MKKPKPWWALTKHLEVFSTTSPFMLNRVFNNNQNIALMLKGISVPCDICSLSLCKKDGLYYVMPIEGNSWHAWDSTLIYFLYCFKYNILLLVLSLVIIIVIYKFSQVKQSRFRNNKKVF